MKVINLHKYILLATNQVNIQKLIKAIPDLNIYNFLENLLCNIFNINYLFIQIYNIILL